MDDASRKPCRGFDPPFVLAVAGAVVTMSTQALAGETKAGRHIRTAEPALIGPVYESSPSRSIRLRADVALRVPIRGIVRPFARAVLSTSMLARIVRIGFREGQAFRKGDVLVAFDCRRQRAERRSAAAKLRQMQIRLRNAEFLKKRKANSQQDVDTAHAEVDEAAAKLDAIDAGLAECQVVAPYDGRVTELSVQAHETPNIGTPLLSIAATSKPEIELIVPSHWLNWLAKDQAFEYTIDETGEKHIGLVSRLGAAVDTVSQTIKVYAQFKGETHRVLPGMSGTAKFVNLEQ